MIGAIVASLPRTIRKRLGRDPRPIEPRGDALIEAPRPEKFLRAGWKFNEEISPTAGISHGDGKSRRRLFPTVLAKRLKVDRMERRASISSSSSKRYQDDPLMTYHSDCILLGDRSARFSSRRNYVPK